MQTALPSPIQEPPLKMDYLKCERGGLHEGENLNLVCLEKTCQEKLVCCCACFDADHKKHKGKPLKMLLGEARAHASSLQPRSINLDIVLDIAHSHQERALQQLHEYKRAILQTLEEAESALRGYFSLTIDQLLLRNSDSNLVLEELLSRATVPKDLPQLRVSLKKVVALLQQQRGQHLSQKELIDSLQEASSSIKRATVGALEDVGVRLGTFNRELSSLLNSTNIWAKAHRFSPTLKHKDIMMVGESEVRAGTGSGYRFALMEPGLGSTPLRTFSLKVVQSSCNWLAVGVCYREVVARNKYGFTFGSLGQGAYLVSTNGGCWSHSRKQHNNVMQSFKFSKDDVLTITVDQQAKTILFRKEDTTYSMPFDPETTDQLHPCVLFYYPNDAVAISNKL